MNKLKRLLSGILAAAMSVTAAASTFAPVVSAETSIDAENGGNDYSLEDSNSFGSIVMNEFDMSKQDDGAELEKSDIANISKIVVEGRKAYVAYSSNFDCTLLVGIYDETGTVMYGSGNALISEGNDVISVDINITEMPQYFLVKAYIVDTFSNIPVSLVYETNEYTEVVQTFLSKTAADFDADRVVVLDDSNADYSSINNNFAVYNENVIILPSSDSTNKLEQIDYKNNYYVVANPSAECRALNAGDIAAIKSADDWAIVKVLSVTDNGSGSLIIQGSSDFDMEDVFRFIKIDSTKAAVENEEQSLSSEGYDEVYESKDTEISYSNDLIEIYNKKFELKKSEENRIAEDTISLDCEISGTLEWTLKAGFELRFDVFDPSVNSFDISLQNRGAGVC